jgi:hypothetical protein
MRYNINSKGKTKGDKMAQECVFCGDRGSWVGTRTIVLNGLGWVEFCPRCGQTEVLTNGETGESWNPIDLYLNTISKGRYGAPLAPEPLPAVEVPEFDADKVERLVASNVGLALAFSRTEGSDRELRLREVFEFHILGTDLAA